MKTCARPPPLRTQVEREARVAEPVFDVVAEDPQVEHVAEKVQPAAVQEHRREDGGHVNRAGTTPYTMQKRFERSSGSEISKRNATR